MAQPIDANPLDYLTIAAGLPPLPIPPGPVHPGGTSPVDAVMAAFGAATNSDLVEANALLAQDHADRTGHASDAARKFTAYEDDAVPQFQDLAAQGDALGQAMQGVTGALGGVLGSVGRLPQELMQAGQGALSPLMSAAQSLGNAGLGDTSPASDFGPVPGDLVGGGFGSGGGGGGPGMGTTPAGNLGPSPVPGTSTPTTPAASMTYAGAAGPGGGAPTAGGTGGPMMPMVPGGAGAGKSGKDDNAGGKRIAAPGIPNGQPVKGRTTTPPNVPVTKSVAKDVGRPGITPLKRIAGKDNSTK